MSRLSRSRFLTLSAAATALPYVEWIRPALAHTKTTNAQRLHDLSHAWGALHASWNGGRQDAAPAG